MLADKGDDGDELVDGAVGGADGRLEGLEGEGAVVERELCEDRVLGARSSRGRVLAEPARVLCLRAGEGEVGQGEVEQEEAGDSAAKKGGRTWVM